MDKPTPDLDENKTENVAKTSAVINHNKKKIVSHNFNAPLPEDLKKQTDAKKTELKDFYHSLKKVAFDLVPGWVVKREFFKEYDRLKGAQLFANAINTNNYDELTVPEKYAIKDSDFEDQLILAKRVNPTTDKITLTQTQQLFECGKKLRWNDANGNFSKIEGGKVVIWDTEMHFFHADCSTSDVEYGLASALLLSSPLPFDDDSIKFLQEIQTTKLLAAKGSRFNMAMKKNKLRTHAAYARRACYIT
jgi:hypothetical protein